MYIRRTTVKRCNRSYLSIAHNVWHSKGRGCGESRTIVFANLGAEMHLDTEFAREVVNALERCVALQIRRGANASELTRKVAAQVRVIEPFLRVLVSRRSGLTDCFPKGQGRDRMLEGLLRSKLDDPENCEDSLAGILSTLHRVIHQERAFLLRQTPAAVEYGQAY